MIVRGVRGAVQARRNSAAEIRRATRTLLEALTQRNRLRPRDVAAAIFTVTEDLTAEFPARAARELGWADVPMICNREIPVPGAMKRVVRVLLLVNVRGRKNSLRPVYLGETAWLRPDLAASGARPRRAPRPRRGGRR